MDGLVIDTARRTIIESKRCIGTRWVTLPGIRRTVNFLRSFLERLKHEKQWQGSDSDGVNSVDKYSKCSGDGKEMRVPGIQNNDLFFCMWCFLFFYYRSDWYNHCHIVVNCVQLLIEFLRDVHLQYSLLKILVQVNSSTKPRQLNQRE